MNINYQEEFVPSLNARQTAQWVEDGARAIVEKVKASCGQADLVVDYCLLPTVVVGFGLAETGFGFLLFKLSIGAALLLVRVSIRRFE